MRREILCDYMGCKKYESPLNLNEEAGYRDDQGWRCTSCQRSLQVKNKLLFEGTKSGLNCFLCIIIAYAENLSTSQGIVNVPKALLKVD